MVCTTDGEVHGLIKFCTVTTIYMYSYTTNVYVRMLVRICYYISLYIHICTYISRFYITLCVCLCDTYMYVLHIRLVFQHLSDFYVMAICIYMLRTTDLLDIPIGKRHGRIV